MRTILEKTENEQIQEDNLKLADAVVERVVRRAKNRARVAVNEEYKRRYEAGEVTRLRLTDDEVLEIVRRAEEQVLPPAERRPRALPSRS